MWDVLLAFDVCQRTRIRAIAVCIPQHNRQTRSKISEFGMEHNGRCPSLAFFLPAKKNAC